MSSRYYDDKEAEIVPGKISDELRSALNLAENDVPIWIYRMRALGYPPGWLNKAIVDTSDIFDTDEPDGQGTSGKRKTAPSEAIQYDHSKLIEYPGFNTPLPPGANDYHYYHNMPPMLPHQQLDYAKKTMNAFKPAPLPPKRFRAASPSSNSNHNVSNSSTHNKSSFDTQDSSPAFTDLETPASPDQSDEGGEDNSSRSTDDNVLEKSTGTAADCKNEGTKSANQVANTSTGSIPGEIKLVSKGSPMPQPVKRLPLERFSEGVVGELLYFENIPNSTGKFESIRGLLSNMRRSKSENDASFGSVSVNNASSISDKNEDK